MRHISQKEIGKRLKKTKRIFLFLDYDGTLTPIVKNPLTARLTKSTKQLLKALSEKKNVVLGIISGRAISDLKRKVGIRKIIYAGSHGLELWFGHKNILLGQLKPAFRFRILKPLKRCLKTSLAGIKGVVFEDKGFILSLHYRKVGASQVSRFKSIFKTAVAFYLKKRKIKISGGKKVLEIRPNISFAKSRAVKFFQRKLKRKVGETTIFIGDDLTDEEVFLKLNKSDIAIRVGKKKSSKAKYYLKDTEEVERLLAYILNQ